MSEPADSAESARRPRPEYGEYATPEEVARVTGRPITADPDPSPVAADLTPQTPVRTSPGMPGPLWDRALTAALFVVGAWAVSGFVLDPLSFSTSLEASARNAGFTGEVIDATVERIGRIVGAAMVVVFVGALLAALLLRPRLRLLFWIPLSAALLSAVVLLVGLSVALAHVPGLLNFLGG